MSLHQEEKLIVQKIINKDEKALFFFYNSYKNQIFKFINRKINDTGLSEEITQDVFLDFIEALRDFHFQCTLKTYIFSIAKNKTIDVIRKKKIKKLLFSSLPSYLIESIKTVLIDDEIEKKEISDKIKKTFNKLPNDYRLVLRLKYIEGEKVKRISKKMSLKFKATESLIFRARKAFIEVFKAF